jgi:hypothetical protein
MPHLTKAQWIAQVEECGGDLSKDDLINLIFKDGPNVLWSDTVKQLHVQNYGIYNQLMALFPHRVWADWSGVDELEKTYHAAYIPFDMSIFQRSMQVCDPDSLNECHTDYCEIPKGGISNRPPLEMYKTGFKTKPMCIANIRTSSQARQIARMIVEERFSVDEQVMNAFYTMAVIRMLGHKWILEYEKLADGTIRPVANSNPYNILGGYRYNFMNPLFPQVGNINNIMPLDFYFLDSFGRALTNARNPNFIAKGSRNEPIFELWYPDDMYHQEIIDNPEFVEKCKCYFKANELMPYLPGYTLDVPDREVIGNFAFRSMPNIPRFAESTMGGLTVVQPYTTVEVDHGVRPLHNHREWDNAPFYLTVAIGKGAGEILTRPALTTGIEGRPIMPIDGSGQWIYRNDYDKECNEDLNMPHFRKRYEMGFRMLNPDASWGFISRAKNFRIRPINTCNLKPIFSVTPVQTNCEILTIGCNPLNDRVSNNIIEGGDMRKVLCQSEICGSDTILRLTFRRENVDAIAVDQNPLGSCACGDDVTLLVGPDNGAGPTEQVQATLIEYIRPNMVNVGPIWYVELAAPLTAGFCVKGVVCEDETPTVGRVVFCQDNNDDPDLGVNKIRMGLDSKLSCDLGDNVTITYYDADNVSLGTKAGTLASVNHETLIYEISATAVVCDAYPTQAYATVTCVKPKN